jgi:molybdate transport system substrate-binding protein
LPRMGSIMKRLSAVLLVSLIPVTAQTSEITLLTTGIFRGFYPALISKYEETSSDKIKLVVQTPFVLKDSVINGLEADAIIAVTPILKDIESSTGVVPASKTEIGRVYTAVVIRAGAPKPDLSTLESVKRSISAAKAVAINDPKGGSAVGRFLMAAFDKYGFDDELRSRFKLYPGGGDIIGGAVVKGEADFGISISSEIIAVKGTEIAGALPPELNVPTVAYGFVSSHAKEPEGAKAFLAFLHSPAAKSLMSANGIQPK